MRKEIILIRKMRVYHTFNFDKPSFIYLIENEGISFKLEFIHTINCKIIINGEVFYCAPSRKFFSRNNIILNEEKKEIGTIRYYGWIFQDQTIKLESETENWVYRKSDSGLPMIKKQERSISIDIIKNEKPFRFRDLFKEDDTTSKVRVIVEGEIENQFLLVGLAIYMFELDQLSIKN